MRGDAGPKRRTASVTRVLQQTSLATEGMHDVHASERLRPYLRDVWRRRRYAWYVARQELRQRQITSLLGNLWHLLNPALTITVYFLVFSVLLDVAGRDDNYLLFLTVGLFTFSFTQRSTTMGATSVTGNKGIIKAFRFPRALLPVTSTLTETLASIPTFVVMYVVAVVTGEPPTWRWLLFAAVIALQFVFNLGAAMIAARLATHFVDTTQVLPFVFRLLLYGSGVMFNVSAYVSAESNARWFFVLNPLYCFVELARWCIFGGALEGQLLASAALWTVATVVVGLLWFHSGEDSYGRD